MAEIGRMFNDALVVVESNNHGPITLGELREIYPIHLLYRSPASRADYSDRELMALGFRTTARTKPIIIGRLRQMLAESLRIYSPILYDELMAFVEDENGKLGAEEGYHDDTVMAMAMAVVGLNEAAFLSGTGRTLPGGRAAPRDDPFSLESILQGLRQKGAMYPISPQHNPTIGRNSTNLWMKHHAR